MSSRVQVPVVPIEPLLSRNGYPGSVAPLRPYSTARACRKGDADLANGCAAVATSGYAALLTKRIVALSQDKSSPAIWARHYRDIRLLGLLATIFTTHRNISFALCLTRWRTNRSRISGRLGASILACGACPAAGRPPRQPFTNDSLTFDLQ